MRKNEKTERAGKRKERETERDENRKEGGNKERERKRERAFTESPSAAAGAPLIPPLSKWIHDSLRAALQSGLPRG